MNILRIQGASHAPPWMPADTRTAAVLDIPELMGAYVRSKPANRRVFAALLDSYDPTSSCIYCAKGI